MRSANFYFATARRSLGANTYFVERRGKCSKSPSLMELCSLCSRTTCDGLGGRSEIKRTHQSGLLRLRRLSDKKPLKSANFLYAPGDFAPAMLRSGTAFAQPQRERKRKRQFAKPTYVSVSVCESRNPN